MSEIDYIYHKLNEFHQKTMESPTRIILGRETYIRFLKESKDNFFLRPTWNSSKYGDIMGMTISLSKRPNYVRIMPAKLKYRFLRKSKKDYRIYSQMTEGLIVIHPDSYVSIHYS